MLVKRRMGVADRGSAPTAPGAAGAGARRWLATHTPWAAAVPSSPWPVTIHCISTLDCRKPKNSGWSKPGYGSHLRWPLPACSLRARLCVLLVVRLGAQCHLPLASIRHCRPAAHAGWQAEAGLDCVAAGQGEQAAPAQKCEEHPTGPGSGSQSCRCGRHLQQAGHAPGWAPRITHLLQLLLLLPHTLPRQWWV